MSINQQKDGYRKSDEAIYQDGTWYLLQSTNGSRFSNSAWLATSPFWRPQVD